MDLAKKCVERKEAAFGGGGDMGFGVGGGKGKSKLVVIDDFVGGKEKSGGCC